MWSPRSGGDSSLNTTFSVTPHAFAPNYNTGHNSIFEMETKWFIKNLIGHFCARPIPSEFSSWTASPVFALRVAYNAAEQRKERNVHIAIVDTERLKNTVLSVPLTWPIFRSRAPEHVEFVRSIHFEYLIHGVVQGEAYKAVSLTALDSCGLSDYFSALKTKTGATRCIREHLLLKLPEPVMTLSGPEAKTLFKIATLYGEGFCVPFFVALVCCKLRPGFLTKPGSSQIGRVILLLREHKRDTICSVSGGAYCINTYNQQYDDCLQMQRLFEALAHCF